MDQVLEAALEETPGPRTSPRKLRRATAQTPPKVPRTAT